MHMKNHPIQLILNGKRLFWLNVKFILITSCTWTSTNFSPEFITFSHTATEIHPELRIMILTYSRFKQDVLRTEINLFKT